MKLKSNYTNVPAHIQANSNNFLVLSKKFSNPQPDIPLAEARTGLDAFLNDYLQQHRLITIENDKRRDDARKANKRTIRKVLPMAGAVVTVGVGKTESAAKLAPMALSLNMPMLYLGPTKETLLDSKRRIERHGGEATIYQGRQYPTPFTKAEQKLIIDDPKQRVVIQIKNARPHDCYQKEAVDEAGEQGHRPTQSLCNSECPHGRAGAMQYGNLESQADGASWFDKRGLSMSDFAPCQYIYHGLPEQLKAKILLAPFGAFSSALTEFIDTDELMPERDEKGRVVHKKIQRLVVVDEAIENATELPISHSDVAKWIDRIDEVRRDRTEEETGLWDTIRLALSNLNAALLNKTEINNDEIINAAKAAAELDILSGGTARWERIRYTDAGYETPLRALMVLKSNINSNTLVRSGDLKKLHIYDLSPIYLHAQKHGSTVFMDATMPLQTKVLINAAGGTLHQATSKQNITVTRVTGVMYQRGKTISDKYDDEHARPFMRDAMTVAHGTDDEMAVILHKSILDNAPQLTGTTDERLADFERQTGQKVGYFGRHDRGFDGFKNRHLAIFGQVILGPDAVRSMYGKVRALLEMSGISMPPMPPATTDEEAFLPTDPVPRALIMDYYAQGIAQAIGRARGVNAEQTLRVNLYGGYDTEEMDAALLIHGVTIDGREVNDMRGEARQEASIMKAIEAIEADNEKVSVRKVIERIKAAGGTIDRSKVVSELYRLREAGRIPEYAKISPAPASIPAIECYPDNDDEKCSDFLIKPIHIGNQNTLEIDCEIYGERIRYEYVTEVWEGRESEMTASEIENSQ